MINQQIAIALVKKGVLNRDIELHGCKLQSINYAIIKHVIISKNKIKLLRYS